MKKGASLSECGTWRWLLDRRWDVNRPILVVCMLNPSTADAQKNDPTVLALIHFAKLWGYGGITIVNLYAFRSPSPAVMKASPQRHSPRNTKLLEHFVPMQALHAGCILVAWGNDGDFEGWASWFTNRMTVAHGLDLICLGKTSSGAPKHPMARGKHRIPRDQQPILWRKGSCG
ncbi:MAG: DUF1643 domain-containing protein [Sandaracinobacter sp.]